MLPEFLDDVSITSQRIPCQLEGATSRGVLWQAAPGHFLLNAPDTARYLVEKGQSVSIDRLPGADETRMLSLLRMTPLAALLFQRGIIALHAAAVGGPDGAVLIAGDSGAGKSTLLAALLKRGWKLLSDDLAVVNLDGKGLPTVLPTFPELTLWANVLQQLKIKCSGTGRHILFMADSFTPFPQPLRAIYRLSVHKEEIALSKPQGMTIFHTLSALLYNSRIADTLLDRAAYMRLAAAIAGKVPLQILRRPRERWCFEELADLLERDMR